MTVLHALGITIGSAGSVAVGATGVRADIEGGHASGGLVLTHRSALRPDHPNGPTFADATHADGVVLEGFPARVGDPVDIMADDGSRHAAHDLAVTAVECLIGEATAAIGSRPAATVLCHPARWPALRYVLANALGDNAVDPFDPAIADRPRILRESCRTAKEILSGNTATTVCSPLDVGSDRVRPVRDELEELLRDHPLSCLDLVRDVAHRAGIGSGDLDRVLVVGGGASIPLVTELISGEFGLPVVTAPEPAHTAALGAAVTAADLLAGAVPDSAAPAPGGGGYTPPSAPSTGGLGDPLGGVVGGVGEGVGGVVGGLGAGVGDVVGGVGEGVGGVLGGLGG